MTVVHYIYWKFFLLFIIFIYYDIPNYPWREYLSQTTGEFSSDTCVEEVTPLFMKWLRNTPEKNLTHHPFSPISQTPTSGQNQFHRCKSSFPTLLDHSVRYCPFFRVCLMLMQHYTGAVASSICSRVPSFQV